MTETFKDLPVLTMPSGTALGKWLAKNHAKVDAAWLKIAKKNGKKKLCTYEQAREQALIWGWIDGQAHRWDDDCSLLRLTPRRRRSKWSKINRDIVEQLIADGLMMPPGIAQVEAAKADGRWDAAYASSATIEEPADFLAALAASPAAEAFYPTIRRSSRFTILSQIYDAKRPETRARRIAKFVARLAKGEQQ